MAMVMSIPFLLFGQFITPETSPLAKIHQRVGFTDISVEYSRPDVRGRKVFGGLIPYGKVWRTGANEASKIRFSKAVQIGGTPVPAGTYAIYTLPNDFDWIWILSRDTSLWGARGYDPIHDVLRLSAKVTPLADRVETMEFRFMNIHPQSVDLVLEWEYTQITLPILLATDAQVKSRIAEKLSKNPTGTDYYRAARYYLDNHLDLDSALTWMQQRVALGGEQFGILRYKGLIEYQLGDTATARETLLKSLKLAREAGNEHYIRINENTLSKWSKRPTALSAKEILQKSIAYHDPDNKWSKGIFNLGIYEERPGNPYRFSEITLDNEKHLFTIHQRRGKDLIYRVLGPDTCMIQLNGLSSFTAEEKQKYRLGCEQSEVYRNYYTYLWGVPMKLLDVGTKVHDQVWLRDYAGQPSYEIKVSYDPEIGGDTWYFYFHPETFALIGYKFYHDESKNDGEYIVLFGEREINGIRLPKQRKWFTNEDERYLGVDELVGQ